MIKPAHRMPYGILCFGICLNLTVSLMTIAGLAFFKIEFQAAALFFVACLLGLAGTLWLLHRLKTTDFPAQYRPLRWAYAGSLLLTLMVALLFFLTHSLMWDDTGKESYIFLANGAFVGLGFLIKFKETVYIESQDDW